jgi:hypothetical protein
MISLVAAAIDDLVASDAVNRSRRAATPGAVFEHSLQRLAAGE